MNAVRGQGFALVNGDCREALKVFRDHRFDSCVSDPPYELGFMGKRWDRSGVAYSVDLWREVLRTLKPGAHLLAFGGTRTYHRMTCAIEDAGFEVRDSLHWFYGTGFPKSLNVGRELLDLYEDACSALGSTMHPKVMALLEAASEWEGWGTALKPAHEPVVLARKPLVSTVAQNLVGHGAGALNINACRLPPGDGRWPANVLLDSEAATELDAQTADLRVGGSLKGGEGRARAITSPLSLGPRTAWEPYGDSGGASRFFYVAKPGGSERDLGCDHLPTKSGGEATDRADGSAGVANPRAGAGRGGGRRNYHPTVKPVELMRYLVRLITPSGGTVLDPFTGSGTTGMAARLEGAQFVGMESASEFIEIARSRITAATRDQVPNPGVAA